MPAVQLEHREELAQVFERFGPLLARRAELSLGGDPLAAEDVVQDAFVTLLERFDEQRHDAVRALLDAVRDRPYDARRRRRHHLVVADVPQLGAHPDPAETAELRAILADIRANLTATEHTALHAWLAGYTLREIAEVLGRPLPTIAAQLRRARERARQCREAWAGVGVLLPVRRWLARLRLRACEAVGLVGGPVHDLVLSLVLGVTAAAVSWPGAPSPAAVGPAVADVVTPALTAGTHPATAPRGGERTVVDVGASADHAARPSSSTSSSVLAALPHGSSWQETPEDMRLVSAAPSPHFTEDHTIVALGVGTTCSCPALLRSTDGGASWTAASFSPPAGVATVVLPPDFPADTHIFLSSAPVGGAADVVADAFDQPFSPLPLPPGPLAVSAQAGDLRVFVATAEAVMAYDLTSHAVHTLLAYPGTAQVATLATPLRDPATDLFVLAPAGTLLPTTLASPTPAVTLFTCSAACRPTSTLPLFQPGQLVLSPSFATDRTILVARGAQLEVSSDAGSHFAAVPLPRGVQAVDAALTGPQLWLVALGPAPLVTHTTLPATATSWLDATTDPALTRQGVLVVASPTRILDLVAGLGFRCTTDLGRSWAPRCPPL